MRLVVTGGAGFIGSNFILHMLAQYDDVEIVNFDKLTYAGNLENLRGAEGDPRYSFIKGDICDVALVREALRDADAVVNFAAETHVDRSISDPQSFIRTDVLGTQTLLEAVREHGIARYVQISTDEVYGSTESGSFTESSPLDPSSPYSASKAAGDLLVLAYRKTYGLPVLITRSSNNYGPRQYPEKIVPLFVTNALDDLALPVYGDGRQVRDWIYVDDNCAGIDAVLRHGRDGEIYNIGGGNEIENLTITREILRLLDKGEELIRYVADRPGHDRRYSIDCTKAHALGWRPATPFVAGLERTVAWYRDNPEWWRPIKSGEWRDYYAAQYPSMS